MAKKILVVDDERDMVSVLVKRLRNRGYETNSARDGEEALKMVERNAFDLFILDIMMPTMDGAELAQALRDNPKTKDIPVIFLTALQTKEDQARSLLVGPHVMFAKPFYFGELARKVAELLNGG
jgi:CheY-like chemotaxis protein